MKTEDYHEEQIFEGGKSFFVYATNMEACYNCSYCILTSVDYLQKDGEDAGFKSAEIGMPPGYINPDLRDVPVAVNNSFGDPGIQWQNTVQKLQSLEKSGHSGPTAIITKSGFTPEQAEKISSFDLETTVIQSLSKLPSPIEPENYEERVESMENLVEEGVPTVAYFRPIIPGYNDSEEIIETVIDDIANSGVEAMVRSGLMGTDEVLSLLEERTGSKISPPEGYDKWDPDHKLVSDETEELISKYARKKDVELFQKTSCGVTYVLDLPHDYNLHFAEPKKHGCESCPQFDDCIDYAEPDKEDIEEVLDIFEAEGFLTEEEEQIGEDQITWESLNLKGTYTEGEISVLRWLSSTRVDADNVIKTNRIRDETIEKIKTLEKETKNKE